MKTTGMAGLETTQFNDVVEKRLSRFILVVVSAVRSFIFDLDFIACSVAYLLNCQIKTQQFYSFEFKCLHALNYFISALTFK